MITKTSNHQAPNLKQSRNSSIINRLGYYVCKYCLIIGYCVLVITGSVTAENLTVSLRVGLSSFTVSGYTAPLAMVTVKQNGVIAGTTLSDSGGNFSKTIDALEADTYTFHIYSTDSQGQLSNAVKYVVAIGEDQNLALDHVLLPPTLTLDTLDTSVGEDVRLHGESYPLSTIRLFLADALMATTLADASGRWYGLISTTSREAGEYHVYAHASHPDSYQSIPSTGYTLTLRARGTVVASPTTSPSSELPKSSELLRSDLTVITPPSVDTATPSPLPLPPQLAEGNMIRLILVGPNNRIMIYLLLLMLLLLLFWLFWLLKRRRQRDDQKSKTTSPS